MQIVLLLGVYWLYRLLNRGLDILEYRTKHTKREDRYEW